IARPPLTCAVPAQWFCLATCPLASRARLSSDFTFEEPGEFDPGSLLQATLSATSRLPASQRAARSLEIWESPMTSRSDFSVVYPFRLPSWQSLASPHFSCEFGRFW